MTQKVTHHQKKCSNKEKCKEKCKCRRTRTKRRNRQTKTKISPLIHQAALPPFSSVIPNPVSSKINKPYYVETNSIHPDVVIKKEKEETKVKEEPKVKDEPKAKEEPSYKEEKKAPFEA